MRSEVVVSPQFDLCYALADLASPNPHFTGWPDLEDAVELARGARSFGWVFWLGLPDLVDFERPAATVAEFADRLSAVTPGEVVPRLHRSLVQQPTSRFSGAQVREWLHFIGADDGAPSPSWGAQWDGPMDAPLAVLNAFRPSFEKVWKALGPQLQASAAAAREKLGRRALGSVVEELDPSVQFDEQSGMLRTARGYKLPLSEVGTTYLLPSVFNSRRFKTLSDYGVPRTLYIPFLLAETSLPATLRQTSDFGVDVDPWLVCRAIGNPTRASILQLIADRPRPAFEIQRQLDLSKANVSHHIFQLREAGLITERRIGRTVELAVRLEPLRGLSRALVRELGRRRQG